MKQIGIVFTLLTIVGFAALGLVWPSQAAPTQNIIIVTITDDAEWPDGFCSLREALHNANNNMQIFNGEGECAAGSASETDVIRLTSGETYSLTLPGNGDDEGDLDILNNSLPLDLRIDVDGAIAATINMTIAGQRVMEIHGAVVEIDNVTISGGVHPDAGGGILNNGGALTLINVSLQNNSANSGGGLYNDNGTVLVGDNTQIVLNTGALGGGGIFNSGMLTVSNSMVRANNSSGGSGGGIYNGGGTLVVQENSAVNLNTAAFDGGGIYLTNDTVSAHIQHSMVDGNQADNDGGGIYFASLSYEKLLLEHSQINGNTAGQNGGGAWVAAQINHTQINDNSAANIGGGLYTSGSFFLHDVTVRGNTAVSGGGLGGGQVYATQLIVAENEADQRGGGLYVSYVELQDSQVISNTAGTDGGGLYSDNNVFVNNAARLERVLVAHNNATNGGGVWAGRRMTLGNVTISSNGAQADGGGLYINANGIVTATNVTLAINMPGVDLYKEGEMTLQNSIISNLDQPNCALIATPINSLGNNLSDDNSCLGLDEPTDIVDPDTLLGPLANNGSNTPTHALLDGSPAIDSGDDAACAGPLVNGVDQRGLPRPYGDACDIGAHEEQPPYRLYLPVVIRP